MMQRMHFLVLLANNCVGRRSLPFHLPPSPSAFLVPIQLALACILLERAIRADRLSDGWHLWHHESEALACTTVAAVAVRVMALDGAIDYCREGLGKQAQGR